MSTARLDKLQDIVLAIMEVSEDSRADDNFLAYKVYRHKGITDMNDAMKYRRELGLPSVESIGRVRRQIQRLRPELRADKQTEVVRYDAQVDYMDYAAKGEM